MKGDGEGTGGTYGKRKGMSRMAARMAVRASLALDYSPRGPREGPTGLELSPHTTLLPS